MHTVLIISALFTSLTALAAAQGAAQIDSAGSHPVVAKPAVQYDDTDIAPPLPDSPDSTDPLFDDPDEMTEINEPDSYGEEPLQNDGVLPDDTDSGEINPAE